MGGGGRDVYSMQRLRALKNNVDDLVFSFLPKAKLLTQKKKKHIHKHCQSHKHTDAPTYLHVPGGVVLGTVERLETVVIVLDLGRVLDPIDEGVAHVDEHVGGELLHDGQGVPVPVRRVSPAPGPDYVDDDTTGGGRVTNNSCVFISVHMTCVFIRIGTHDAQDKGLK